MPTITDHRLFIATPYVRGLGARRSDSRTGRDSTTGPLVGRVLLVQGLGRQQHSRPPSLNHRGPLPSNAGLRDPVPARRRTSASAAMRVRSGLVWSRFALLLHRVQVKQRTETSVALEMLH